MDGKIEVIVGAILRSPNGKILLIRQRKWDDVWTCFVGGHLEFLEPIVPGLIREIREETGLSANEDNFQPLANGELIRPDKPSHLIFLNFLCIVDEDQPTLMLNDEIQEASWVYPKDAVNQVLEGNKQVLRQLLAAGTL